MQCLLCYDGEKMSHIFFSVQIGDTIPGYVAATKLVVNINLLKQVSVQWQPDKLHYLCPVSVFV